MIVTGEDRSLNAVPETDATIVGGEVQKKQRNGKGEPLVTNVEETFKKRDLEKIILWLANYPPCIYKDAEKRVTRGLKEIFCDFYKLKH